MSELPYKLAEGKHPVTAKAGPIDTLADFKAAVDSGDFARGSGRVRIAGRANLEGVDVRCEAEIDLASLEGRGRLVIL